ncbi:Myosin regulatory light chain 2B, cardiac muscle isoform [Merluccius polli]|uniref:Myosin regulatory light chain 2B, cardiac muscle isoform n=1 Tax=Merluccius polli TaxID=89951 RepID=A0AA47MZ97_MERPO|nr:Myosin regulatory light chain 2B, cardiac muscle isoform [Merluccius polli]
MGQDYRILLLKPQINIDLKRRSAYLQTNGLISDVGSHPTPIKRGNREVKRFEPPHYNTLKVVCDEDWRIPIKSPLRTRLVLTDSLFKPTSLEQDQSNLKGLTPQTTLSCNDPGGGGSPRGSPLDHAIKRHRHKKGHGCHLPTSLCQLQYALRPPGMTHIGVLSLSQSTQLNRTTIFLSYKAPKKAKKKTGEAGSNVFTMFEQSQIQEFKEAFTIMDQNRDGFIDKGDLRDTFAALGRLNVGNDELDEMMKEAPGPINFTIFLAMFGEKLKGTDPEETILNAFKMFDPEGKGVLRGEDIKYSLMTQADKFTEDEVNQMFTNFPLDVAGNLDYTNLCYVITHGEDKEQE